METTSPTRLMTLIATTMVVVLRRTRLVDIKQLKVRVRDSDQTITVSNGSVMSLVTMINKRKKTNLPKKLT